MLEDWDAGSCLCPRPGQVRLKVGVGEREPQGVSNGTYAYGTAPPVGPGTEVSHSAAGRGAPAGQWHWPALGGPESTYGPGSLLELGRSRPGSKGCIFSGFNKLHCLIFIVIDCN